MTVVFYDGLCGLCDHLVHFLLVHDREAQLRFAPLQGELARTTLLPRGHDPSDLNTVYVIADWKSPHERVLERSRAVLYAVVRLGGGWRLLARIASVIPRPIADAVYRVVARTRYRLFGRFDACPLPLPEWRERFLDRRLP